jgi:hypothetical protein
VALPKAHSFPQRAVGLDQMIVHLRGAPPFASGQQGLALRLVIRQTRLGAQGRLARLLIVIDHLAEHREHHLAGVGRGEPTGAERGAGQRLTLACRCATRTSWPRLLLTSWRAIHCRKCERPCAAAPPNDSLQPPPLRGADDAWVGLPYNATHEVYIFSSDRLCDATQCQAKWLTPPPCRSRMICGCPPMKRLMVLHHKGSMV